VGKGEVKLKEDVENPAQILESLTTKEQSACRGHNLEKSLALGLERLGLPKKRNKWSKEFGPEFSKLGGEEVTRGRT